MKFSAVFCKGLLALAFVVAVTTPAARAQDEDPNDPQPWGWEQEGVSLQPETDDPLAAASGVSGTPKPTVPSKADLKKKYPKGTKPPVNATCPIVLRLPDTQIFTQGEGGFVILKVTNPYTQPVTGVVANYTLPSGSVGFDPNYASTGGAFAYPPGTNVGGNRRAQKARSSPGAPAPQISSNLRTVTYTFATIPPKTTINVVVPIKIEPGVTRTNTFNARGYYTFNGVRCRPVSNSFVISYKIKPIATLQSTAANTYQRYASVYRICAKNVKRINFTSPVACADACDATPKCQVFVMAPPANKNYQNQTCYVYNDITWGNDLLFVGAAGNATAGFERTGSTIYLKNTKPKWIFGGSTGCVGP